MKGRKHRAAGGETSGTRAYDEDLATKNQRYTYQSKVNEAAEERKRGGKVAKKTVGKMPEGLAKAHAGRKARKSGGRANATANPFSSARSGTPAKGRHTVSID